MDGVLNINKPSGITSHGVVCRIRNVLGEKKVGHTGTLDPEARGVLPICIGRATKLSQYISNTFKIYSGVMKIGVRTDTQDITGRIISEGSISNITEADIKRISSGYEGELEQTPPMYSAVKYRGKRLYTLARKGITVKIKSKRVYIYYLNIKDFKTDLVSFEVKTSPGTYVRTLCDNIGEDLGCGATLHSLIRLRVGFFDLHDSITLSELDKKIKDGTVKSALYPYEDVKSSCEKLYCQAN